MTRAAVSLLLVLVAGAGACSKDPEGLAGDSGSAGARDAADPDAGDPTADAGLPTDPGPDTGLGEADATAPDTGLADSDAAARDGAALDAGPVATSTDPFAHLPSDSAGLTNVAADLRSVLENGALPGACAAWEADRGDRRKKLLCGKHMFFYESFGTAGLPLAIVDSLIENFPEMGPGFGGVGLIEDPYSTSHRALGLSTPSTATTAPPSVALTCASCHFARLDDGRYAVGAPNHAYDYGTHMLAVMLLPQLTRSNPDLSAHHPDAIAKIRPLLDRLQNDRAVRIRFLIDLLPLLTSLQNGMVPMLSVEDEGHYAGWLPGTQDFAIPPVPVNDGVHTISKISALWSIPTIAEWTALGLPHAMLGWVGEAPSLEQFVHDFIILGQGATPLWPDDRLSPLVEYVYSLRPPTPPAQDPAQVARGAALFTSVGCLGCHDGPRGSGRRLYAFGEVGTDDALRQWMDPDGDGEPCCGMPIRPGARLSHQVKSPRLLGLWSAQRFLHNGSVPSLESLLCVDGPRGTDTRPAYGDRGHTFGCELGAEDKAALAAFLRSH